MIWSGVFRRKVDRFYCIDTKEIMSQDLNVRFRGTDRKTGFCSVNSLIYSGTKRSTTSEGLRSGRWRSF